MKKNNIFLFVMCFIVLQIFTGCEKGEVSQSVEIFRRDSLYNGDAKFYGDNIITSVGGKLSFIDLENNDMITYDVQTNWIDSIEEEGIIVYGNQNNEVGLCRIDNSEKTLISNTVLFQEEKLAIDPSLIKIKDQYFLTITLIDGNVNNLDASAENGHYAVELYTSKDLQNWEYQSSIVTADNNIEDGELFYWNKQLYFLYEKEELDKGNSSIELKASLNMGKTWEEQTILVAGEGDNEPGGLKLINNSVYLFYSSDIENIGKSYEGAEIYQMRLDNNLDPTSKMEKVGTLSEKGKLLYDIKVTDDKIMYLFTENYFSESNLVVESNKIASIE